MGVVLVDADSVNPEGLRAQFPRHLGFLQNFVQTFPDTQGIAAIDQDGRIICVVRRPPIRRTTPGISVYPC